MLTPLRKNFISVLLLPSFLSCAVPKNYSPAVNTQPLTITPIEKEPEFFLPATSEDQKPARHLFTLASDTSPEKLSARLDAEGVVTILNYPQEWTGRIILSRFDGQNSSHALFSPEFCREISKLADYGHQALVRTGYQSVVLLELPNFLSSDFLSILRQQASKYGIKMPLNSLANPIERSSAHIDLVLDDEAISKKTGKIPELIEQFNLAHRGSEFAGKYHKLLVISGDILCDFAAGHAKLEISFPALAQGQNIKLVYTTFKIALEKNL